MDIVDQLRRQVHIESAAIAPQTSRTIEIMKLAIEEIERLRISKPSADQDQTQPSQIQR